MRPGNAYLEFVQERFSTFGEIHSRYLFGGYCLYCDGVVFALVADSALFLKADEENRSLFETQGLAAFRPFEDQTMVMKYYQAPPEIFEDDEAMRHWVGGAIEAGRRAAVKRKPKAKRK